MLIPSILNNGFLVHLSLPKSFTKLQVLVLTVYTERDKTLTKRTFFPFKGTAAPDEKSYFVMGGITSHSTDSTKIHQFSCDDNVQCSWNTLPQALLKPRVGGVAMLVPSNHLDDSKEERGINTLKKRNRHKESYF